MRKCHYSPFWTYHFPALGQRYLYSQSNKFNQTPACQIFQVLYLNPSSVLDSFGSFCALPPHQHPLRQFLSSLRSSSLRKTHFYSALDLGEMKFIPARKLFIHSEKRKRKNYWWSVRRLKPISNKWSKAMLCIRFLRNGNGGKAKWRAVTIYMIQCYCDFRLREMPKSATTLVKHFAKVEKTCSRP